MFDPSNTVAIGIGITAFVATIMTVFVLMTAYHERPARYLGYAAAGIATWSWLGFAYHLTESIWIARELRILSIIAQLIAQLIALRFVYIYLEQVRRPFRGEHLFYRFMFVTTVFFILVFVSDALFGTHLSVGELTGLPPEVLSPEPGPFMFLLLLFYYLLAFTYGYFLYQRVRAVSDKRKRADIILLVGMVGAFVMGGVGFATWYDITGAFTLFRGLAVPFYMVAMLYSITSYQLFNVRVAAAEAFVFAMWGFLFLRILLQPSLQEATTDIIILGAFIVLGLLLIRNVTQELKIRLELEEVSEELRELNESLGEKVMERTRDLARAQEHVEHMVNHLPVGLIEVNENGKIARMNNVAMELTGVKKRAAIGKTIQSHESIVNLVGSKLTAGTREVHLESPHEKDIEVVTAPLLLEDSTGYVIVARDITEKRALERTKNEFIATAAHQLRTPLSAIKWTFELLSGEKLKKQQQEMLTRGTQGVENLERIAEALMMSIRTSQGVANYTFEETTLAPVFENILTIVTPLAEKKQIDLQTSIPDTLPVMKIDTERMGFAIQNLLDNAVKYTPEGGSVTLTVKQESNTLKIEVTDSGIGMTPEDQQHLFEKFFRSKKATEMSTDGSGLGLVIVKSIIDAHGGTIDASSTPDVGSTFCINLPVHTEEAA